MAPSAAPTAGSRRASRSRRWLRRLLLAAGAALAVLLLAELVLGACGLYPPAPDSYPGEHADREHPHFVADPRTGWRMRPLADFTLTDDGRTVHYAADEHGHRSGPPLAGPSARERLVVLAGDSFFWGAEVEHADSLAAHLAAALPAARIVNLAQPGFGVDQMMLAVVHQGLPLRPDLVIVGIYPQDCSRSHTAYRADLGFGKPTFRLAAGALVPWTAAEPPPALATFLAHRSRLFGLLQRALRNVGLRFGIGPWWALNAAILDELHRATAAAGVPLLLVHVPLHDWRPFGALTGWAQQRGVPLIDPVASDPQEPPGLYFEPDAHFTPRGHRWLADRIIAWIAQVGPPALR